MEGQVESIALWDTVLIAVCIGCTVHMFYTMHGAVPIKPHKHMCGV